MGSARLGRGERASGSGLAGRTGNPSRGEREISGAGYALMTGTSSSRAMCSRSLKPSMSGMWTSLRTMSKSSRRSRSVLSASAPRMNVVTGVRRGKGLFVVRDNPEKRAIRGARQKTRSENAVERTRGDADKREAPRCMSRGERAGRLPGAFLASGRTRNLARSRFAAPSHLRTDTSGASCRRCEGREGRHRRQAP